MEYPRITRMLNKEEVCTDLGIGLNTLDDLVAIGLLSPTFLGRGWKFSQEDILEFQRKTKGYDIRNYAKAKIVKEKIDSAKSIQS